MVKQTPLFETHKQMGAKIVNFGGWYMPMQYTNIIDEHINTREKAGLFDVSHMAEIELTGKDSFMFVQWLITNDISKISGGKALYTPLCYENGTFVDDIIVYMIKDDHFLLVLNASNADKDIRWINKMRAGYSVKIIDTSNKTAQLALQGPMAGDIVRKITGDDIKLGYFEFAHSYLNGKNALISRTGYTGEDGYELYFSSNSAVETWNLILEAGKDSGVMPVGLGARDTLRQEACLPLYGNDIDDTTTPIEAGLDRTVKFYKEEFVGKKALLHNTKKLKKRLIAFEMMEKAIARHNYPILKNDSKIGYVTSGTFSPTLKKPIGMGYVDIEYANVGEVIGLQIRNKQFEGKVVPMPFVQKATG